MDLIKKFELLIINNFSFDILMFLFLSSLYILIMIFIAHFDSIKDEKSDNEDNKSDKNICKEIRED